MLQSRLTTTSDRVLMNILNDPALDLRILYASRLFDNYIFMLFHYEIKQGHFHVFFRNIRGFRTLEINRNPLLYIQYFHQSSYQIF